MEEWKAIPGYEGFYEVSDLGRVRSVARYVKTDHRMYKGGRRFWPSKIRKLYTDKDGRQRVSLQDRKGGRKPWIAKVHTLVMLAFVGPRPDSLQIAHGNGNPSDNRLVNLRYATPVENCADKWAHGTQAVGEKHHTAKLTEENALDIIAALKAGNSKGQIAKRYGVSIGCIGHIKQERTWPHLPR